MGETGIQHQHTYRRNTLNTTELKQLLDACFLAKHLTDSLPALPGRMKPRHIHVLDTIYEINCRQNSCRVSDVCAKMRVTMPSITKLIQELEAMGMVTKYPDEQDKRAILLKLTASGQDCIQKHILDFHSRWAERLPEIDSSQVNTVISVIQKLQDSMPEMERRIEKGENSKNE